MTPSAQVNKIMEGVADGPVSTEQRYLLLRMGVAGLEALAKLPPAGQLGKEAEFAARYPFLENSACRAAFLDFALKVGPLTFSYIHTPRICACTYTRMLAPILLSSLVISLHPSFSLSPCLHLSLPSLRV